MKMVMRSNFLTKRKNESKVEGHPAFKKMDDEWLSSLDDGPVQGIKPQVGNVLPKVSTNGGDEETAQGTQPYNADINGDGTVGVEELLALIAAWGDCDDCPEDINGDGTVDVSDLLIVIGNWGPVNGNGGGPERAKRSPFENPYAFKGVTWGNSFAHEDEEKE